MFTTSILYVGNISQIYSRNCEAFSSEILVELQYCVTLVEIINYLHPRTMFVTDQFNIIIIFSITIFINYIYFTKCRLIQLSIVYR